MTLFYLRVAYHRHDDQWIVVRVPYSLHIFISEGDDCLALHLLRGSFITWFLFEIPIILIDPLSFVNHIYLHSLRNELGKLPLADQTLNLIFQIPTISSIVPIILSNKQESFWSPATCPGLNSLGHRIILLPSIFFRISLRGIFKPA